MIRRIVLAVLCATLSIGISSSFVWADKDADPKDKKPADEQTDSQPAMEEEERGDRAERAAADESLMKIADDAELSAKGKEKFNEAIAERQTKLDAWKSSDDGKKLAELRKELSAARRAKTKDEAKIKELQGQIKPLTTEYRELSEATRGEVLKTLTDTQQRKVVEAALFRRVNNSLDAAGLSADQGKQVRKLCDDAVPAYLKDHPLEKDPYMRGLIGVQSQLVKSAKADILTEAQREAVKADRKSSSSATTKPKK